MKYTTKLILGLIILTALLPILGSFIGCVNMVSGSSGWCESIAIKLGL